MAYQKMKCFNRKTTAEIGYLGTEDLYVKIKGLAHAASVQLWWDENDSQLYLDEELTGYDRYLGNHWEQASWEWKGAPIDVNADGSVSLTANPLKKLYYKDSSGYPKEIWWTDDNNNDNILCLDSAPVVTHNCRLNAGANGDFWEHSMNGGATYSEQRKDGSEFYCEITVQKDTQKIKLKIENNCGRKIRIKVYDLNGNEDPRFPPQDIISKGFATIFLDISGVPSGSTMPFKTGGFYLDRYNNQNGTLPDPKFTITRKGGG